MSKIKDWKAHVEAHKFTGPTVKVLAMAGEFAVLDHEYNLKAVTSIHGLAQAIALVQHPPQRERPKPQLFSYDYETRKATPIPEIDTGDLDL